MSQRRVTFIVGANIRNFETNSKKVERRMHQMGRQATFLGRDLQRSVTMPVLAAGGSILALAQNTAQYADRVSDLADVTGMSTDALQEWDFVAKRVGVSTDVIERAFSSLGRRMSQFQRGSGPAVDAARQLGVEFRNADGSMRNADDLIMDLLGSLNEMPADLDRAGIGTQLFGRRWEMLAPIIGRGIDNIEQIREEAQELGLVMDGDALASANQYREEMVKFQEQMAATGRTLAIEFMPTILEFLPLAEKLVHTVGENVQNFADLDQQVQINRIQMAAYAAAIGPLLILFGSLITSGTKIIGMFRAMTVFAMKNPYVAIGVGVAGLVQHVIRANREIGRMNDAIREARNLQIQGDAGEVDILNNAIEDQIQLLEQTIKQHETMGVVGTEASEKQLNSMRMLLGELVQMRDTARDMREEEIISDEEVQKVENLAQKFAEVNDNWRSMRQGMDSPEQTIIDPSEELAMRLLNEETERFNNTLYEIYTDTGPDFSHRLQLINDDTKDMSHSMNEFGNLGVQIFDRMVFQGEKLSSTLKSIKRQLATRGIMTLLTGGFGASAGGFMGGIRSIFGVNDAIISPKGDVITTHPDDYLIATKDPAGMANNVRDGGGGSGFNRPIIINLDGREVWRNQENLAYKRGQ